MIISYPGYKKGHGKTCNTIAELIDLYPTLVELTGLKDQQPKILQGQSLASYVVGNKPANEKEVAYTITGSKSASIRTNRWRYTRWGEKIEYGNEELYDHQNDPEEHVNLADNKKQSEILIIMREKFEVARKKAKNEM